MVPFIHRADAIELTANEPVPQEGGLFDVVLSHAGLRHRFTFHSTFIERELASALQEPGECEVHVIALNPNSLASLLINKRPQFVVTAVSGHNRQPVSGLPRAWRLARRCGMTLWLAMTGVGLGLAALGEVSLGAFLCSFGALAGGPASRLPSKSFLGHEGVLPSKLTPHDSPSSASPSLLAEGAQHSGPARWGR